MMMAVIGTFTYEFTVSLPLLAQRAFSGGANAYAAMTAAMGLGAVVGGLYTASRAPGSPRHVSGAALFFGLAVLLTAVAPTLPLTLLTLLIVGFCSIRFTALANTTLQLESAPEMRGRVMALWTMAFLGSTPIGGPIIGWIGDIFGPRWALALGGSAALLAAGLGAWALRNGVGPHASSRCSRDSPESTAQ
jgi:MFS family permease